MTASVLIGIVALILFTCFGVAVAVIISQALSRSFLALERSQRASAEHLNQTLDRLMTVDWEKYVALRSYQETDVEQGGFEAPEDEEETEVISPVVDLGPLRERMTLTPDEQDLLNEDFPEEMP